jgi:hypothetical protein
VVHTAIVGVSPLSDMADSSRFATEQSYVEAVSGKFMEDIRWCRNQIEEGSANINKRLCTLRGVRLE